MYGLLLHQLLNRLRQTPGREHEQAIIRLIIGLGIFTFITLKNFDIADVVLKVRIEIILYTLAGLIIFVWIAFRPKRTPSRYVISAVVDMLGLSYAIHLGQEFGAAFYPLYLWVSFGYGFRFGRRFLAISATLNIIGFITVYLSTTYWQQYQTLFYGLLAGLILLPAYAATLVQRLEQAIVKEKQASQAKSQFLANMSHELRTPLNGIIGCNDLMRDTELTSAQRDYVLTIDYSVQSLLGLIENILDLAKIEAGKTTIHNAPFDLHRTQNHAIRMLSHHAANKGLELFSCVDCDVPYALIGDERHVRQVMINLIGNAIKYTETGHVQLSTTLVSLQDNECRVRFEINDTGHGISEEVRKTIFERFTQTDESHSRKHTGAGLGTAIAKELISAMNGDIGVFSTLGQGSTFWFELPFTIQVLGAADNPILDNARILVITDNVTWSKSIEMVFQSWGVTSEFTLSPNDALHRIHRSISENKPFHAVLINKSRIDIDANEFAKTLKTNPQTRGITLIYLAQNGDATLKQSLTAAGFDYVMTPPLDKSMLFNAIHSAPSLEVEHDNVELFHQHLQPNRDSGYRILVAEDNEVNQMVISKILESGGHIVTITNDGEEALEALEQKHYDAAIFDMQMPVMDGITAIKTYRYTQPDSQMPIIMLTANTSPDTITQCMEAGASLYLAKPVRSSALLSAINGFDIDANRFETELLEDSSLNGKTIIDDHRLQEIDTFGEGFLRELIEAYQKSVLRLYTKLNDSADVDYHGFITAAHEIKGCSANVGAVLLASAAEQAEALSVDDFKKCSKSQVEVIQKLLLPTLEILTNYSHHRHKNNTKH